MAVDLDALAAELRAAGYFAEDTHGDGLLKVGTNTHERYTAHCVVSREGDVHPARNSKVDWTAFDIIRRHVSPEPSRGISRAMADAFWSAKEVYSHSNDADVDICKRLDELSAVIDAQLSAPEPSRRAAVDVQVLMAVVETYGDLRSQGGPSYHPDCDKLLAAIRALLEPHDAARLRETIARAGFCAFIGETNLETHLWADLNDESKELWFEIADAVIRAIGGAR